MYTIRHWFSLDLTYMIKSVLTEILFFTMMSISFCIAIFLIPSFTQIRIVYRNFPLSLSNIYYQLLKLRDERHYLFY